MTTVVVDYGMGNLGSVMNMFRRIGVNALRSGKPDDVAKATKLVLPGVGAFDRGMEQIRGLGLESVLYDKVVGERTPVLGICLGMQLMAKSSEEGQAAGLGWIDAKVVRFTFASQPGERAPKVPHMGWNYVRPAGGRQHPLISHMGSDARFYFVHSYYFVCERPEDALLSSRYGGTPFTAAVARGNIVGAQFHPEKSHRFGEVFYKQFAAWAPAQVAA